VPKLWTDTIEEHRREVRDAILDATADLVQQHGLASVAMSAIAERAGIGRATLYKYFPDVEAILVAWHERHVAAPLAELGSVRDSRHDPVERLSAVLERFALIAHQRHDSELAAMLHRGDHVVRAQQQLERLVRELIADGAKAGALRDDVAAGELASFCLHALTAASSLPTKAAVHRLVEVTLAGLRRQRAR
jgi:AcrR family transcriptional regulator